MPAQSMHQFQFLQWRLLSAESAISFSFQCDTFGTFVEKVSFPVTPAALRDALHANTALPGLLNLLHIALGVSYYKCAAATNLCVPPSYIAQPGLINLTEKLYTEGLAEFFVRAAIAYPSKLKITPSRTKDACRIPATLDTLPPPPPHSNKAIVAFGGGKDSYVARHICQKAKLDTQICAVALSDKVADTLQRTAPEALTILHRRLAPQLSHALKNGALNGHVPITCINILLLTIYAALTEASYVVFANERSADEPTLHLTKTVHANHQYSKSGPFEGIIRTAIQNAGPTIPNFFSVLRPFSELWIAHRFSQLKAPFLHFTSCNKNFPIAGQVNTPRWCGDCAKCAFTALLLAPFLPQHELVQIFKTDFLNAPNLLPIYRQLAGLTSVKPWDCVGTIPETRACIFQLAQSDTAAQSLVVREILPQILQHQTPEALTALWHEEFTPATYHFIPDTILEAALATT